jgi:hypothetical protein
MVTNYGNVMIVYKPYEPIRKSASYDRHGRTKAEVIATFRDFAKGKHQASRIEADLSELESLPEGTYSITCRQRVGHRYHGKLQCGEEIFASRTISW